MKKIVKKIIIVATVALTLSVSISAASNDNVVRPLHEQNAG